MGRTGVSNIVLFLILCSIPIVMFILLSLVEYIDLLFMIFAILTPLTAIFTGALGLRFFSRQPERRQDRFHILFLWLSIGIFTLSLSELAIMLVAYANLSIQTEVTVGLVQMPGVLIWSFGILQYLQSMNTALEITESSKLWIGLLIVTSLTTLSLVVINTFYVPWMGTAENIILSPIVSILAILTGIALCFMWILRKGEIVKILAIVTLGLFLFLIRTIYWVFLLATLGTPLNSLIAFESYMFLCAALISARNLVRGTN